MNRVIVVLLVVLATFSSSGCSAVQSVEPTSLKFGTMPRIIDLPLYVAQEEGIFRKHNLEVELIPFRSAQERNVALQVGEIQGTVEDPIVVAMLNKEKEIAKVVASSSMPRLFEVVVAPGSKVAAPAGLKNVEIGLASNTIMDYALDRLWVEAGLDLKDIRKVDIPSMPLRVEMLCNGKIEAAILTPPLSSPAIVKGGRVILDDTKRPFAGTEIVFTTEALRGEGDGVKRFLVAWDEAVVAINASPDKYQSLMAKVANVPPEAAASEKTPLFPKLGSTDKALVESKIDWLVKKGILAEKMPYEKVVSRDYFPTR